MTTTRDVIERLHNLMNKRDTGFTFLLELQAIGELTRDALDEIDDTEYELERQQRVIEGYERRISA